MVAQPELSFCIGQRQQNPYMPSSPASEQVFTVIELKSTTNEFSNEKAPLGANINFGRGRAKELLRVREALS